VLEKEWERFSSSANFLEVMVNDEKATLAKLN
jgi:hypothetical protein